MRNEGAPLAACPWRDEAVPGKGDRLFCEWGTQRGGHGGREEPMEYDNIDVDAVLSRMVAAVEHGKARPSTKRESMAVQLVALSVQGCQSQHHKLKEPQRCYVISIGSLR
jgi:hypothetical protein